MKKPCVLFLLLVILPGAAGVAQWKSFGIDGFDPQFQLHYDQTSGRILASVSGTLLWSDDRGASWSYRALPAVDGVKDMWVKGRDSIAWPAFGGGIAYTTDFGKTVLKRQSGIDVLPGLWFHRLTGNERDRNDLWIYENNLYHSTDFGEHWENVYVCKDPPGISFVGLHPADPNLMYFVSFTSEQNYYLSRDAGKSWSLCFHSDTLSAGVGHAVFTPQGAYIYSHFTADTGKTWTRFLSGGSDMAYNPRDGHVYLAHGDLGLARLTGTYLETTSLGLPDVSYGNWRYSWQVEVDTTSGELIVQVNDTLYIGREGAWRAVTGIHATPVPIVYPLAGSLDTLYAGCEDYFLRSHDGGKSWRKLVYWGTSTDHTYITAFPADRKLMLFGCSERFSSRMRDHLLSRDGGDTFDFLDDHPELLYSTTVGFLFDPFDTTYVYGLSSDLWRQRHDVLANQCWSINAERFWTINLPNMDWVAAAFDPSRRGVMYACGNDGPAPKLYRSMDHFKTWTEVGKGLIPAPNAFYVHPKDPARLYVASGSGLTISSDTGATWRRANAGFQNLEIKCLAFDDEHPNVVYAASNCAGDLSETGLEDLRAACSNLSTTERHGAASPTKACTTGTSSASRTTRIRADCLSGPCAARIN